MYEFLNIKKGLIDFDNKRNSVSSVFSSFSSFFFSKHDLVSSHIRVSGIVLRKSFTISNLESRIIFHGLLVFGFLLRVLQCIA